VWSMLNSLQTRPAL